MKKKIWFLVAMLVFSGAFSISLSKIVDMSKNPSTLFKSRDDILKLALSYPSSPLVLKVANKVYSKIKIMESAHSTSERMVANAVVKENKNEFYTSLASSKITTLPSTFSLAFNVLDIRQDYSNFFSHIYDSDYTGALKYFSKIKYIYKIPSLFNFLPKEDTSSLWSFLAQGVQLDPNNFDIDGAKFISIILTPYEIRTLYMKTYVWLSGLSVQKAQQGLSVVDFENLISSFSKVKLDPNLLQWKYMTSKYLSLYTSISDATRQLAVTKNIIPYVGYVSAFYRSIQDFPSQYRQPLSKQLSIYLDLLIQKLATVKVNIPSSLIEEIRKLATMHPNDPNSPKLMALTLNSNIKAVKKAQENTTKILKSPSKKPSFQSPKETTSKISYYYYISIIFALWIAMMLIPRIRLSFYRVFKLKKMEMNFYMKKLSKSPEDFRWHIKLAKFYEDIGKLEEAQREYSLALKLMHEGGKGYEDSK